MSILSSNRLYRLFSISTIWFAVLSTDRVVKLTMSQRNIVTDLKFSGFGMLPWKFTIKKCINLSWMNPYIDELLEIFTINKLCNLTFFICWITCLGSRSPSNFSVFVLSCRYVFTHSSYIPENLTLHFENKDKSYFVTLWPNWNIKTILYQLL